MLTVQFGQCGNQLGQSLFSKISCDIECVNTGVVHNANYQYVEDSFNKWFNGVTRTGTRLARAILVDTEEKVVNKVCEDVTSSWTYCTNNVGCQTAGGSANNWAYGYMKKSHQFAQTVLNMTQREIEKIDHFDGFLLLLSSAGGTGSGVGSYITELLREEYKTKTIICVIVLPFSFGEVSTQSYNTILSFAKLYSKADALFMFENEQISNICSKLLKRLNVGLHDLNDIISEKLAAVFQPTNSLQFNMNSLISQIASHPCYKLATIKSTPHVPIKSFDYEPAYRWESYVQHLKRILRVPALNADLIDAETKAPLYTTNTAKAYMYCSSVSNILFTRGLSLKNDLIETKELTEKNLYVDWVRSDYFNHVHQNRQLLNQKKFLALLTNNSQLYKPLDIFLDKAWTLYTHSAFLHHYKNFGLQEDDFLEAFAKVENVVKDYKELSNC